MRADDRASGGEASGCPTPESVLREVAVVVCDPTGEPTWVSPAAASMVGCDVTTIDDVVHPADRGVVADAFVDATVEGTATVTFRTAVDEHRLGARLSVTCPEEPDRVVVVLSDASREGDLDDLLRGVASPGAGVAAAASRRDVVRTVEEAAAHLEFMALGWYLRDGTTAALRPGPGREAIAGAVPTPVRETARTGLPTTMPADAFPNDALPVASAAGGVAVPLGDHGVLVAGVDRPGDATPAVLAALETVAALVALAFDRLDGRERFQRTRAALDRARAAADRLEAVGGAVRRAESRVVDAESNERVSRAVCEEVAGLDGVAFAWYGRTEPDREALVPETSAGDGPARLDDLSGRAGDDTPVGRALDSRSPVHLPDVSGGARSTDWRRAALAQGFRSAFAVPVVSAGTVAGVLTVYGTDVDGLDELLRTGVTHLARVAGHALAALDLRSVALGGARVELVLSVPGESDPLGRVAAVAGSPVEFESATPISESAVRVLFSVDAPPSTVREAAAAVEGVGEPTAHHQREGEWLYESVVTETMLPALLASHGAAVIALRADVESVRATVALPRTADVRSFVDAIRETYPGAELLARRVRDGRRESEDPRHAVDERLTDRQREVLYAAYHGGYFEWPREKTGSEVARDLGITQPTFSRHLRTAERRLLNVYLDGSR